MPYKITPRVDLAFKKIFGVEENKDLTISLINSILAAEDQVSDITLLNPYNPQNFANDKLSILDIKAESADGKRINIEIQVSDQADYDKRALYYWAKLYTEQLATGKNYSTLNKAIGIHILNFTSIPETEQYHNTFQLKEKHNHLHYFKNIELHTIELDKFDASLPKPLNEFVKKIRTSLDLWSSFLTRYDLLNLDNLPTEINKPELKKALTILQQINFTKAEHDAYEDRLKWLRDETSALEKKFNDGVALGRAEGIHLVAKNMIEAGMSVEQIIAATQLPQDVIMQIKCNIAESV